MDGEVCLLFLLQKISVYECKYNTLQFKTKMYLSIRPKPQGGTMKDQDEPQINRHVPEGVSRDGHKDQIPASATAGRLTALEEAASQIYLPVTE